MPKGIVSQLIVAAQRLIADQRYVWKSGVILEKNGTTAEVVESYEQREIKIRVAGQHRKELLTIVTYELDNIHEGYRRLKVDKLIPCNCHTCKDSQEPHSYRFEVLREFLDAEQDLIQCRRSFQMVDVRGLIDDVLDRARYPRGERMYPEDATFPRPEPQTEPEPEREIFISYAWGGESEEIVDQLDATFQARGVTILRDKREVGYKERIKAFMERLGRGKCVIAVISKAYLESDSCMHELVQIARNKQFYDRIFPIVLNDAKIYKPTNRIKHIQYWEQQIEELDEAMRSVGAAKLQGFREEIDSYTDIRNTIAELLDILTDTNALTPDLHRESGFEELFEAIERKMAK